jgi:hypothetical protein
MCLYTNLYVFLEIHINLFKYVGAQKGGEILSQIQRNAVNGEQSESQVTDNTKTGTAPGNTYPNFNAKSCELLTCI